MGTARGPFGPAWLPPVWGRCVLKRSCGWVDQRDMSELFDRRGIHLLVQMVRFVVAGSLWCVTLLYGTLGLARFSRVFTGDVSFGALDGFQFVEAMYGAFWRMLLAVVACWAVWRVLRWDPGGRRAASAAVRDRQSRERSVRAGFDPSDDRACPLLEFIGVPRPGDLRRCPLVESRRRALRRQRRLSRPLAA